MGNTGFGSFDKEALIKNFNAAKENENFNLLTSRLDLPDEVLMKYTSSLEESVSELTHCKNCKHLKDCKNKMQGFVYYPSKIGNHLKFGYVACKYEKMKLEYEKEASYCDYFNMPEALRRISMKNIEIDDAKRVNVIKWLKAFYDNYENNKHMKGLYLHGSFGSGKTFLICSMLNELSKKHVRIVITYFPELLRSLKESFSTEDFPNRMSKLKKCDILFIDDIGAESVTEWARDEILGTILQYRMDNRLPTFFTSNLNIQELEVHLSSTKSNVEKVKAKRIIERILLLTEQAELVSKNRRN